MPKTTWKDTNMSNANATEPGPGGAGGSARTPEEPVPDDTDRLTAPPVEADGLLPRRRSLEAIVWPVRTERLTVRRADREDLDATWEFRRLDNVSRWLTRAPATFADYQAEYEKPSSLAKTLVVELDGVVIGDLMLQVEDGWAQAEAVHDARAVQAELGCVLHPDFTGRGYATEAVGTLLRLSFRNLGLRRVTAHCFADNVSSWRLMERLGMRRETHTVRESLHRSGTWLDGLSYALLAEEWQDRQGHSATAGDVLVALAGGTPLRDGAHAGSTGRDVADSL